MLDRQPRKAKENFNTSFMKLTKTIPKMWKRLVLTKVEENRSALPKSQLIAITAAAAMNVFEDVTLLGADLGIICRKI